MSNPLFNNQMNLINQCKTINHQRRLSNKPAHLIVTSTIKVSFSEKMSYPLFYNQMTFPNEILMQIFNHLDSRSLNMAGSVCKKWRSMVQMVHEKAWKSMTKAVQLKPKSIGPKYKKIGWFKNKHTWNKCKCLNIARDLVFYDDLSC